MFGQRNIEKFLSVLHESASGDGCWIWPMAKNSAGYGHFCLIGGQRTDAGRYCATLMKRKPLRGEVVGRSCERNACVNPRHLYWIALSMKKKQSLAEGKFNMPPSVGEDNPAAVLDDEKVLLIRQSNMTGKKLARLFSVSPSTISACQLGHTWPHLPGARGTRRVGNPDGGYCSTRLPTRNWKGRAA